MRRLCFSLSVIGVITFITGLAIYFNKVDNVTNKKAYLTFVDDDTRVETYTYWNRLANEMGVKITLAVVPNWVNGNYPPGKPAMTLTQLREMYDAGHDLVSHGYDTLTVQEHLDDPKVLYTQLHDARQWLIDNGFTRNQGYDTFVWPQGLSGDAGSQARAKEEVRKYYKFAINAFTKEKHLTPGHFDLYNIPRATSDGQRSLRLMKWMHDAIEDGGWMIVLSHSWHEKDYDNGDYQVWASRYRDLIKYARANDVEIITLSEGLKIWCNENCNKIKN